MGQGLTITWLPAPLFLTAASCLCWGDKQSERQPRSAVELRTVQLRPSPLVMIRLTVPLLATAATSSAAVQLRRDPSLPVYVSGDARSTAERLVQLGVAPSRIAGDSCARTTWENATRAFARQGLQVHPLTLRESAATLLYRLQGRM